MSPTLADIARHAKTSVSTVSRVMAGGSTSLRISAETRKRVEAAAEALGYRPNLLARSLRSGRTQSVAMLVSDIANPWFGQLASLVEQTLHQKGYSLVICNSGEDEKLEQEYLRLLPQKGMDGMIVVSMVQTKDALARELQSRLPIVLLDRPIEGIRACVYSDPQQLTNLLCDALEKKGVKDVALVAGPENIVTHRTRAQIIGQRMNIVARYQGPAQIETGRAAWREFATRHPQAIVCTNNFLGQGVLEEMSLGNGRPPIVAFFDEVPMIRQIPVPIVCARQDVKAMAESTVELLMLQLERSDAELAPRMLQGTLVSNPAFDSMG